jgi:uncharacterized protein (DUF305 family)
MSETRLTRTRLALGALMLLTVSVAVSQVQAPRVGRATTADQGFIDMMVPHHQQGIAMAQQAVSKATHPELRALAEKMRADQQREIDQMKGWRRSWFGSDRTPAPPQGMDMPAGPQFDRMWMEEMFKHHGMSVNTSAITTRSAARASVKQLAGRIGDAQYEEQQKMAGWLQAWYRAPAPGTGEAGMPGMSGAMGQPDPMMGMMADPAMRQRMMDMHLRMMSDSVIHARMMADTAMHRMMMQMMEGMPAAQREEMMRRMQGGH